MAIWLRLYTKKHSKLICDKIRFVYYSAILRWNMKCVDVIEYYVNGHIHQCVHNNFGLSTTPEIEQTDGGVWKWCIANEVCKCVFHP